MLEARLPRRGPTGLLVGTSLQHVRPEAADDLGRRIRAAIGHDEHLVVWPAVGVDGLEAATYHGLLVVGRHEDQEADLLPASGPGIAVEGRGEGEQSKMDRDRETGQAEQKRCDHRDRRHQATQTSSL